MNAIQTVIEMFPVALPFAIDVVIRATLVLAIVQLMVFALRGASAATRHCVMSFGMVALVVLPLLMLALPEARLEVLPTARTMDEAAGNAAVARFPAWKTGQEQPAAASRAGLAEVVAVATALGDGRAGRAVSGLTWVGENWTAVALVVALAAIPLSLLGRLAIGIVALGAIARRAERVTDEVMLRSLGRARERLGVSRVTTLLVSEEINVPVVWGMTKTTLILPVDALEWSRERLRVVLLHEMAHVRRADVVSLFVGRIATALYWFHPMSWIVERDARRECERACDDLVLENGARASEYAHHLLGIASGEDLAEGYASVSLAMARPNELEGRLIAILRAGGARQPVSRRFAWIAGGVLGLALLPIATVHLAARPVEVPVQAAVAAREELADETEAAVRAEVELQADAMAHPAATAHAEAIPRTAFRVTTALGNVMEQLVDEVESAGVVLVGNKGRHKKGSSEGERAYDLGMQMHRNDRFDQARVSFQRAIELGFKRGASSYNIACGYGVQEDAASALRWLDEAIANGFDDVEHLEKDTDLDPIRSDPQFRGLMRDLRAKQGYSGDEGDRLTTTKARADALRRERSDDADAWADVATDLLRLRELDASLHAFDEAIRLSPESSTTRYNRACALALQGSRVQALDALEGAILAGFEGHEKISNDPDLRSIRSDARFAALLKLNDHLALWSESSRKKVDCCKDKPWSKRDEFRESLPRFEEAVRLYPQAGRAWFNLGFAALAADDTTRARDAFGRSLSLGYRRGTTMYNLGCVEAVAGNANAAFEWLRKAEEAKFNLSRIDGDEDLDSLRDDPRFEQLLERAQRNDDARERIRVERKFSEKKVESRRVGTWDAV